MVSEININVSPRVASDMKELLHAVSVRSGIKASDINDLRIVRRSIDSRRRDIIMHLTIKFATGEDKEVPDDYEPYLLQPVAENAPVVIIVGAGPAGLFAALRLIKASIRPIVFERGKDVDARRLDIAALNRTGQIDPDSNYCFGEGGAGTFSDGKLFTRSKKKGDNKEVLGILVDHGASRDILRDSHPHIGSNKLPDIIKSIRETIKRCGGSVHFNSRVDGLIIRDGRVYGVRTADGKEWYGEAVILATGHSARDTLRKLHEQGVGMETKGFAMGVRLEHPSHTIDKIQYHNAAGRGEYLPAAEYNFVTQSKERGVYSFCMCPGGVVVPAVSAPGESVVNGMSASARSGRWSNAGMVVEIRPEDFPEYDRYGVFKLLKLQEDLEQKFHEASGRTLKAPAQRMTDFVKGTLSKDLPSSSYVPGLVSKRVDNLLPRFISERLKDGFIDFDRKAKGFLTPEATVIGLESRTSSPVRLPRDKEKLCHLEIKGLYPAGEGAGYAGGIVSAAIDGMRCAASIAEALRKS